LHGNKVAFLPVAEGASSGEALTTIAGCSFTAYTGIADNNTALVNVVFTRIKRLTNMKFPKTVERAGIITYRYISEYITTYVS